MWQPRPPHKPPLSWWLKPRCVPSVCTPRAPARGFPGSCTRSPGGLRSGRQLGLGFTWRLAGHGSASKAVSRRWASPLAGCSLPRGPFGFAKASKGRARASETGHHRHAPPHPPYSAGENPPLSQTAVATVHGWTRGSSGAVSEMPARQDEPVSWPRRFCEGAALLAEHLHGPDTLARCLMTPSWLAAHVLN